jgi:hypothetical protein
MTSSDAGGRYTIANLPTDSYYIAAGYAEAPSVYPGGTDLSKAKTITVAPTTNLNTLDFQVARPPTPNVVVRGRVSSLGNAPAGGAIVELRRTSSAALQGFALPTISPDRTVVAGPDGKFEFANVGSGSYVVMANQFNIRAEGRNIVVADQTLEVDLLLRGYQVSGRILAEDGSSIPDARLFADAIVTTVDNPSIITSTVLPIAGDGSFGRILVAGEYRFFLRALPAEYSIKSITAGGIDLMKDRLKFGNNEPGVIEVRVTKRTISSDSSTVGVRGRAIDAITAAPAVAERLTLCCRGSGPVERFSSSIEADGSFEFSAIPPGRYAVGLQTVAGTPNLFPVGDVIVGMESITGLEILTTPRFGELSATLVFEDGSIDSASFAASVVFTGTNGRVRVVASGVNGTYLAAVPVGDRYTVSVIDIPQGYAIKSISGSTDLRSVNFPTGTAAQSPSSSRLVITLTRESRQPVVPSR